MKFSKLVCDVNDLLTKNQFEWENRFAEYAKQIKKNERFYKEGISKFQVKAPLYRYTNISSVKDKKLEYDIRFCGQSIATVKVKNDIVKISTKHDKNTSYFGVDIQLDNADWKDKLSSKFRAAFTKELHKEEKGKSSEHHVENILLSEFGKKKSENKKLCNIQPIKLCGLFFQMPTPLGASIEPINYTAEKGGRIDILTRVRHKDNSVRLCVMELKDENIDKEPPHKVMFQAIVYATFIARLLRSKTGNEWYKIFGFGKDVPKSLIINVSIVMPYDKDRNENFEESEIIQVSENTYLKLYSLYFQRNENGVQEFFGSLKDDLFIHIK